MSEGALLESIFETALKGCDAGVKTRKDAFWHAGVVLLADLLAANGSIQPGAATGAKCACN
jgi:hypothetical protein